MKRKYISIISTIAAVITIIYFAHDSEVFLSKVVDPVVSGLFLLALVLLGTIFYLIHINKTEKSKLEKLNGDLHTKQTALDKLDAEIEKVKVDGVERTKHAYMQSSKILYISNELLKDTICKLAFVKANALKELSQAEALHKCDSVEKDCDEIYQRAICDLGQEITTNVCVGLSEYYASLGIDEKFRAVIKITQPPNNSSDSVAINEEFGIFKPVKIDDILNWEVINAVWDNDTWHSVVKHKVNENGFKSYKVRDNSALRDLVLDARRKSWKCDDIKSIEYRSHRDDWEDDYNAKIVVPIRFAPKLRDIRTLYHITASEYPLYGFFSVDCPNKMKNNLFKFIDDESYAENLVTHAANVTALLMLAIEDISIYLSKAIKDARSRINSGLGERRRAI